VVPLAAECVLITTAMVLLPMKPRRADWRSEARALKPIFSLSAPASWLLQRAEAGGSVKGGRSLAVHRSAAETLDGFFRLCQARCLKRGRSDEKEIRLSFLIAVRSYALEGRAGGRRRYWKFIAL
jgi:hypothetical protein